MTLKPLTLPKNLGRTLGLTMVAEQVSPPIASRGELGLNQPGPALFVFVSFFCNSISSVYLLAGDF